MIKISEKAQCCGCSACYNICPRHCISMEADYEGFVYPRIDEASCINCGLCEKVCPLLHKPMQHELLGVYGAQSKDDAVRLNSSSGGMFTEFARWIFAQNGVVFGVQFNDQLEVQHCAVKNMTELTKLQGSKYVQSQTGNTFQEVKAYLLDNVPVLYSGTPCQIAGLKNYLRRDYTNLYTIDVVCHGVPSPLVYKKYLAELEAAAGEKVCRVRFRNKEQGWKNGETLFYTTSKVFGASKRVEPYMRLFLNNITIRPSCAECAFNNKRSLADITIADFWGIDKFHPEFDDDKGTTLVMLNNQQGERLFNSVREQINYLTSNFKEAAEYNVAVNKSLKLHEKRDYFFKNCENMSIKELFDEIFEGK